MYQKQNKRILVLDDDRAILASLQLLLEAEYEVVDISQEIKDAKKRLKEQPYDLMLFDMNYSPGSTDGHEGMQLIKEMQEKHPELPIVVMTAYSDIDLAVQCIKLGASEFIQKPWSNNRLLLTIENVIKYDHQKRQLNKFKLNASIATPTENDNLGMIGTSPAIRLVREKIRKISKTNANVLILGENGTGKELVAKAIHQLSDRAFEPFVKIDLGSLHQQLFESEMFGAKKGAYTGLNSDKIGRMAMADSGTLFLDELGNLELPSQAKLLSALQNREFIPVGDVHPQALDVRLISATNVEMHQLLDENFFRQDLLYRVNTIEIELPALRDRTEDIQLLMDYFIDKFSQKHKIDRVRYKNETLKAAMNYSWPGNIRELEHSIERAVLLSEKGILQTEDLISRRAPVTKSASKTAIGDDLNLESMEKQLIQEALRLYTGNMTKAAEALGLTRAALYRRIEKHGL